MVEGFSYIIFVENVCHGVLAGEAYCKRYVNGFRREGRTEMENSFPECQKCSTGVLVPLSDYGRDGASIMYKAWVCTNPQCGFNLRIDNGEISMGRNISESSK